MAFEANHHVDGNENRSQIRSISGATWAHGVADFTTLAFRIGPALIVNYSLDRRVWCRIVKGYFEDTKSRAEIEAAQFDLATLIEVVEHVSSPVVL